MIIKLISASCFAFEKILKNYLEKQEKQGFKTDVKFSANGNGLTEFHALCISKVINNE
ncbi:MAG: hypothetical protein K0R18_1666 [Bacillales bacterium]|jgi:hypothetical protein|nr:hypothetical protein [Bacillales bacterium]